MKDLYKGYYERLRDMQRGGYYLSRVCNIDGQSQELILINKNFGYPKKTITEQEQQQNSQRMNDFATLNTCLEVRL
jgi:hypothetical protein